MAKYCFGVDVGGTTVKLGCFDTEGTLLEKWEIHTRTENSGEAILPDVADSILDKMKEREIAREDVVGVGIGAPGPIDGEGTVYNAVNLGWGTFSIKNRLQSLLNIPVEKKAMERAQVILENELTGEEMVTVKKIFRSYLVEYVLQFIIAILRIIQLILKILISIRKK